jgi:hypothetical protein
MQTRFPIARLLCNVAMTAISLMISFSTLVAQDKKVEIDIGVNKEPVWYQQPWAWIVGAAIFILLLVALLRGGKKNV